MAKITKDIGELSVKSAKNIKEADKDKDPNRVKILVVSHGGYIM
jgi:hypothetical protein